SIGLGPTETTIPELSSLPYPGASVKKPLPNQRFSPTETTLYVLRNVSIVYAKLGDGRQRLPPGGPGRRGEPHDRRGALSGSLSRLRGPMEPVVVPHPKRPRGGRR